MPCSIFPALSASLVQRRLWFLLLGASLAGCGGPSARTDAPTVPPAASPAHDSVRATLTTPAPDATAAPADTGGVPVRPQPQAPPTGKPKAALPARPVRQPVAAATTSAAPVAAGAPAPVPEPPAAATRTQVGRVLDEAGQPLIGATVLLKGSASGTSTDANGNYSLEVPSGENTFLIGYGGYEDETATARDGQPLTVTLVPTPGARRGRRGRK